MERLSVEHENSQVAVEPKPMQKLREPKNDGSLYSWVSSVRLAREEKWGQFAACRREFNHSVHIAQHIYERVKRLCLATFPGTEG
jgi:hypothetical protein